MKKSTRQKGKFGEEIALRFLEKKGYRLLERNIVFRGGEIDLLFIKNGILIFVEVKTRWGKNFGTAEEACDIYKKRYLLRSIKQYFLKKGKIAEWRCDLITLNFKSPTQASIQHFIDIYVW